MPTSARHPCTNSIKEDITLSQYEKEINRRRTFAIISHPDAGKTTLTEKFLLYGRAGQGQKEHPGRHLRLDGD